MRGATVALVGLVLAAAGCMGPVDGSAPAQASTPAPAVQGAATSAPGPAQGQSMKIDLQNFAFAPRALTVSAGTTVVWQNDDSAAHTVTADNGSFDSGNLNPGAKFQFTFTKPGTYAYYCRYHGGPGGQGMSGQIIVK